MSTDGHEVTKALYCEHRESVYQYVRGLVPRSGVADAEDVVQETFTNTLGQIKNGKEILSPLTYLKRTARNIVISMFFRRRQHTDTETHSDFDDFLADSNTACPERHAMVEEELNALGAGVLKIPRRYQEAFIRRRVLGQSCTEIGERMGVAPETVTSYVGKAFDQLQAFCEENDIEINNYPHDEWS